MKLHPLTVANLGDPHETTAIGHAWWPCGCRRSGAGEWILCSYHEGYDDGAEAVAGES